MTNYINKGDIFKLDEISSYGHGCNCAGAMGKGIALQFKKKFPQMYLEYKRLCISKKFKLGDVFVYKYANGYIFNLGTQIHWRSKADIIAVKKAIIKMLELADNLGVTKIALPRIGAGLGGLIWSSVKEVINEASTLYPNIELTIIENYSK